jgi:rod shape-determining protein MreD
MIFGYHSPSRKVRESPAGVALVGVTFFIALALNTLPYRDSLLQYKPDFVALILVYWVMHRPHLVNFAAAFLLGLVMDLVYATPLGQFALAYSVIALAVNFLRNRFVLLDLWPQAVNVFLILAAGQFALFAVSWVIDEAEVLNWRHFLPSAAGALLWLALPVLMSVLRNQLRALGR